MIRSARWLAVAAFALVGCAVNGQTPAPPVPPSPPSPPAPEAPAPAATPAPDSAATPVASPEQPAAGGSAPAVLIGAGDIAGCESDGDRLTAEILDTIPGTIFTTGDHAYPTGTFQQFRDCYDRAWGRHKARTRPTPGNHDYMTAGARPYYNYFGDAAGQSGRGYYSYSLGPWHIIVLNSEISARRGSPQERWLRSELAANTNRCVLAYWHRPLFSSVRMERRYRTEILPIWEALYEAGADVVLNGHDHVYERFARQNPDGEVDDARGIRQFIVGTGGRSLYPFGDQPARNSEARTNETYGLLKLTLHDDRYDWEFITPLGAGFSDSGSTNCH
ncbi:MAG TPA: metallophosphoesterase [Gemmatimonadaceae bacterium]